MDDLVRELEAELGPKFTAADEEAAIETAAQRLAERHRRAERIRERAEEILEEDEE